MTDSKNEQKYTLGAMKAAKRIASIHEKTVADMGIPQCPEGYRQDIIYTYAAMIDEETAAPEMLDLLTEWDNQLADYPITDYKKACEVHAKWMKSWAKRRKAIIDRLKIPA